MLDYTNLFSPSKYEKYHKIISKHFQQIKRLRWNSILCYFWYAFSNVSKIISFSFISSKCEHEDEKIFKEEESVEILKIIVLIEII